MNQILSAYEKLAIIDESIQKSWNDLQFARAIESAILSKLNSAEPVAYEWVDEEKGFCISHNEPPEYGAYRIKPLYLHPPAPGAVEGMTLVPTKILDKFPELNPRNYDHDDALSLNDWGVELVRAAAARGEK